jgi:hypothetical protein
MTTLKSRFDDDEQHEFIVLAERLHRLRADLDTALRDAEDQRRLMARLREEAEVICELTLKVRESR